MKKPERKVKWTPERIKRFGEFYESHNIKELSEHFGYTELYCNDLLKRFGISKIKKSIWEDGDDYLIVGLIIERVRIDLIAEKLEKDVGQIYRRISLLKKKGIYYRLFSQYVQDNHHRLKS